MYKMGMNCWKSNFSQNVYFSEVLARDLVSNQRGMDVTRIIELDRNRNRKGGV